MHFLLSTSVLLTVVVVLVAGQIHPLHDSDFGQGCTLPDHGCLADKFLKCSVQTGDGICQCMDTHHRDTSCNECIPHGGKCSGGSMISASLSIVGFVALLAKLYM